MQNLPEVGKTYISRTDPSIKIYVEKVAPVEGEDGEPDTFHVEGCEPKDKNNMIGCGIEMLGYEWLEHDFIPA